MVSFNSEKRQKMHQMTPSPDFTSQSVDLLTTFSQSVVSGLNDLPRQESAVKPKNKKNLKQIVSVGKTNIAFQPDE